ncbi:MAG TPA: hypothetical protein VFO01_18955 [Trebonia sp.]|nr:hypothetical protein [Trebonia sp.]
MSSRSEHGVAHIVIGEGSDRAIDALLAAAGGPVLRLRLDGTPGDGLLLLQAITTSGQFICSPWPELDGTAQGAGHPGSLAGEGMPR